MATPKKILLLTNAEFGYANCHLAIAHAILQAEADVEVHIASFNKLQGPVSEASNAAVALAASRTVASSPARPFVFHQLAGRSHCEVLEDRFHALTIANRPPTVRNVLRTLNNACNLMVTPWSADEFVELYRSSLDVVNKVEPDMVAVDNFLTPAVTACHHLGVKYVILSPNTLKDYALFRQPRAAFLWKFPTYVPQIYHGFPYPLPWHLIPLNIFYVIVTLIFAATNKHTRRVTKEVHTKLGVDIVSSLQIMDGTAPKGLRLLCANRAEIDMQPLTTPTNVIPCGPIVRPAIPVETLDPVLSQWLHNGPTMVVNLGSLVTWTPKMATEMAAGLRAVLDKLASHEKYSRLQVLWKLKGLNDDIEARVQGLLGKYIQLGQVKIVTWINADPQGILHSKQVVVFVNQGGANSFHESLCAGVPQLVLPAWGDCLDFAFRADFLGIGLHGCKKTQPDFTSADISSALIEMTIGSKAEKLRARTQELAKLCTEGEMGHGRDFAAKYLLSRMRPFTKLKEHC